MDIKKNKNGKQKFTKMLAQSLMMSMFLSQTGLAVKPSSPKGAQSVQKEEVVKGGLSTKKIVAIASAVVAPVAAAAAGLGIWFFNREKITPQEVQQSKENVDKNTASIVTKIASGSSEPNQENTKNAADIKKSDIEIFNLVYGAVNKLSLKGKLGGNNTSVRVLNLIRNELKEEGVPSEKIARVNLGNFWAAFIMHNEENKKNGKQIEKLGAMTPEEIADQRVVDEFKNSFRNAENVSSALSSTAASLSNNNSLSLQKSLQNQRVENSANNVEADIEDVNNVGGAEIKDAPAKTGNSGSKKDVIEPAQIAGLDNDSNKSKVGGTEIKDAPAGTKNSGSKKDVIEPAQIAGLDNDSNKSKVGGTEIKDAPAGTKNSGSKKDVIEPAKTGGNNSNSENSDIHYNVGGTKVISGESEHAESDINNKSSGGPSASISMFSESVREEMIKKSFVNSDSEGSVSLSILNNDSSEKEIKKEEISKGMEKEEEIAVPLKFGIRNGEIYFENENGNPSQKEFVTKGISIVMFVLEELFKQGILRKEDFSINRSFEVSLENPGGLEDFLHDVFEKNSFMSRFECKGNTEKLYDSLLSVVESALNCKFDDNKGSVADAMLNWTSNKKMNNKEHGAPIVEVFPELIKLILNDFNLFSNFNEEKNINNTLSILKKMTEENQINNSLNFDGFSDSSYSQDVIESNVSNFIESMKNTEESPDSSFEFNSDLINMSTTPLPVSLNQQNESDRKFLEQIFPPCLLQNKIFSMLAVAFYQTTILNFENLDDKKKSLVKEHLFKFMFNYFKSLVNMGYVTGSCGDDYLILKLGNESFFVSYDGSDFNALDNFLGKHRKYEQIFKVLKYENSGQKSNQVDICKKAKAFMDFSENMANLIRKQMSEKGGAIYPYLHTINELEKETYVDNYDSKLDDFAEIISYKKVPGAFLYEILADIICSRVTRGSLSSSVCNIDNVELDETGKVSLANCGKVEENPATLSKILEKNEDDCKNSKCVRSLNSDLKLYYNVEKNEIVFPEGIYGLTENLIRIPLAF